MSLIKDYFALAEKYETEYGKRTIVLMQVGAFFEVYGPKTVILARFVPIVRTFAPFVAGIGAMNYFKFLIYSILGALLWVGICLTAGFYFGGFEFVKKRFELVVLAIIFISVLPMAFELIKARRESRK